MKKNVLTLAAVFSLTLGAFAQVTETPVKEDPKISGRPVKGKVETAPSGNTGVVNEESAPVKGPGKEQETVTGKPVKGKIETAPSGNTGVVSGSEAPTKDPIKTQSGTKGDKVDAPIVTDKNHTPSKLPTGNRTDGSEGNKEGKKKGPSQDKIEHAEERSNGHAFSGKGHGAVQGTKEPESKSRSKGNGKGNSGKKGNGNGKKK